MRRYRLAVWLPLMLAACGADLRPADLAVATALHWTVETSEGRFLGSATAIESGCLLTNRHVVQAAQGRPLVARRGDGTLSVAAALIAEREDAALLRVPGLAAPPADVRAGPLSSGEPLAVAGARAGRPLAEAGASLGLDRAAALGPGVRAARLPVAPGFSGGPVTDGAGRLVGIVVAAAAGSLAEAQRLAAGGRDQPLLPRTTIILPVEAALAALPQGAGACGAVARVGAR